MLLETPYEMALGVAKRFRDLRLAKKITAKSVSEKSGVPYSTVRRFESKGEISFVSFIKLVSSIGEDDEIRNLLSNTIPASIEEVIRGNSRKN